MGPGKVRSNLGITTSSIERIVQSSTALCDGNQLADLMIEHNVGGVTPTQALTLKRLDSDYFETA